MRFSCSAMCPNTSCLVQANTFNAISCRAGRVRARRVLGKLAFVSLEDDSGQIQVYVDKKQLDAGEAEAFKYALLSYQACCEAPCICYSPPCRLRHDTMTYISSCRSGANASNMLSLHIWPIMSLHLCCSILPYQQHTTSFCLTW